tara:strand:+ start:1344 stop:1847 length:504 start_codon:yes stop_codon:yes gene_type:complete
MVSILKTDKIQASHGSTIEVPSGHVLSQPGSVIQVLQNTRSTYFETSSDSFVDTGFAITITPKLATSKILLQVNVFCTIQNGGQGSINIYGSAESGLLSSDTYGFGGLYDAGGSTCEGINTINFLTGVVGSTSARTYTLYGKSTGTDNSFFLNNNRLSTFTALEIAQ